PSMRPLRLCLIDMNAGVPNEAMRCFRTLLSGFTAEVARTNPTLDVTIAHIQPRNLGEVAPKGVDLVVSTGGPGSPFDGYQDPWCTSYRAFLDGVVEDAMRDGDAAPSALLVCHSFELAVTHFGIARMSKRAARKFGVQPVYPTPEGIASSLLRPFGDRFFAWE